jgi:hypothetical protein
LAVKKFQRYHVVIITLSIGCFVNLLNMRAFGLFLLCIRASFLALLAAGPVLAAGNAVGVADLLYGQVMRFSAGAASGEPLRKGAQVFQGDTLETGSEGHLYIVTVDQAFISVRPNSRLTVNSYKANIANPNDTAIQFTLHQGVARFVSGQAVAAAKNRFRLNTPVAAIGVRGTDFTVFTTSTVTRASVMSGRIAVSPFNESCLAFSLGPCRSVSSLDLAAGDLPVIELTRGDQLPRILQSEDLKPDRLVPPRPEERPRSSQNSREDATDPTRHPDQLPPVRTTENGLASRSVTGREPMTSLSKTPGELVIEKADLLADVVAENQLERFDTASNEHGALLNWGRWRAIADLPVNVSGAGTTSTSKVVAVLDPYLLETRDTTRFLLQTSGQFSFDLLGYEAFLIGQGDVAQPVNVLGASLRIDFSSQRFHTKLEFQDQGMDRLSTLEASGAVSNTGKFSNDGVGQPGVIVRGALTGQLSTQAGYLFQKSIDGGESKILGATRWAR